MRSPRRDILVVVKNQFISEHAIEQEIESLNSLLRDAEMPDNFCRAHELVNRNRITQRSKKILREIEFQQLRAFRFLLNKN